MKHLYLFLTMVHVFAFQKQIDDILKDGIKQHLFPGAAVIVGDSRAVLCERYYGFHTYEPGTVAVMQNSLFDLASLSKVIGTTMTMLLYQDKLLNLDDCIGEYFSSCKEDEKENITIKDLLTHVSGLQPDEKVEKIDIKDGETHASAVIRHILGLPLQCKPRMKVIYSCLNFYLLAAINEKVAGEAQNSFLKRRFFEPLRINPLYCISGENQKRCVPTTLSLQGVVHDPLARFYGLESGMPGNAGLFSTVSDVAPFCEMILQRGFYQGKQILKPELVDLMIKSYTFS